jgi:hypothetical protein
MAFDNKKIGVDAGGHRSKLSFLHQQLGVHRSRGRFEPLYE